MGPHADFGTEFLCFLLCKRKNDVPGIGHIGPALALHLCVTPGPHPGHPTAEEGCRPASWGLSLALMTCI